jgi:cytochrome P450
MSAAIDRDDTTGLPAYSGVRPAQCPFDPPPEHAHWRERDGLQRAVWQGFPVWVVSRYEDIKAAMTDPRISADTRTTLQASVLGGGEDAPPVFPRMDDPEHARLRMMLTKDFTVRRAEAMRPKLEEMADGLVDHMVATGAPADLVRDYALPIPSLVISALLGVPYSDHEFFQEHSATMFKLNATQEEKGAATLALFSYLLELVERKEREPGDDLISRVAAEYVASGELSREALAINGLILLSAGHETTANMIALGVVALLQNPDQLSRFRDADEPALAANAVEELLRYLSIVQSQVVRVAIDDVTIGGQLVRTGEGLAMNLPAGNRDAAVFDDPDTFDIDRGSRAHLAFGYGVHQCLGQALARMELQVALRQLLRRLPGLRLAVPLEQLRFRNDMGTYGVHELPVTW